MYPLVVNKHCPSDGTTETLEIPCILSILLQVADLLKKEMKITDG